MFALSVVSGAIGRLVQLEIKKGFNVYPTIWTVLVADSGEAKSPCFRSVLHPLTNMEKALSDRDRKDSKDFDEQMQRYDVELAGWKQSRKKGMNATQPMPEKPDAPTRGQLLIHDATMEAVVELPEQNPFGCVMGQDEPAGFFNGFDTYHDYRTNHTSDHNARLICAWFTGTTFQTAYDPVQNQIILQVDLGSKRDFGDIDRKRHTQELLRIVQHGWNTRRLPTNITGRSRKALWNRP
jgi:hypothetical protein